MKSTLNMIYIVFLSQFISTMLLAQDSRVLVGLDGPAYGVKILSKFPTGAGGFARGFSISNQDNSSNFIQLGTYGNYSGGISTVVYNFIGKAHNDTYMTFNPNGNIGIGTNAPQEKLSVNGNIRARQIKVETANWPDYVFNDDYKLRSLSETEEFIQENGHLPDVPKAETVEREGYSLNEMDKILLKKIEELTLYLIQEKKSNAEQLLELKKEIEDLKKK